MRNPQTLLSRAECNALRGIAILGIVLHNYCHWLGRIVKENEYQFFQRNVDGLNHVVSHPDTFLPMHLLSFFGHYGVPVFLFLSAYGLVLKYESGPAPGNPLWPLTGKYSPLHFIKVHFLKLFKMMIVGFVAFTMVDAITPGAHRYHLLDVVAQLLLFNNLLPTPDHVIWPGPYWFFGLMMQLYIVYRLLLYRRHWAFTVVLILVCEAIQLACNPEGEALNRWRYNFVGGMLPFGLGLLTARYGEYMQRWMYGLGLVLGCYMAFYMSQSFVAWTFVPLIIVGTAICLVKILPNCLMQPMEWLGTISAALFVCHPITRKIFIPISHRGDFYTGLLLYVVASIALAWLFHLIMKKIPTAK